MNEPLRRLRCAAFFAAVLPGDVRAGERLVYTRRSGGVDVEVAGRPVGTLEGADFARAARRVAR
jgi:hypothetical protein